METTKEGFSDRNQWLSEVLKSQSLFNYLLYRSLCEHEYVWGGGIFYCCLFFLFLLLQVGDDFSLNDDDNPPGSYLIPTG